MQEDFTVQIYVFESYQESQLQGLVVESNTLGMNMVGPGQSSIQLET